MFSISQTSRGFFCLEWSSTENGPQIVSLNHLKIKNDFSDISLIKDIISNYKISTKDESNSLSVTVSSNSVIISSILVLPDEADKIINWYEINIMGDKFCRNYDNYYYPMYNSNQLLIVSFPKQIKKNIITSSSNLGFNLVYLSLDIFSAATFAKHLYKKSFNEGIILWKVCKNNTHKIVTYKNELIHSYLEIKKKSNKYIKSFGIGDSKQINKLIDLVNSTLIDKKKYDDLSNVIIYQTKEDKSIIYDILKVNKKIKILSFNSILAHKEDNQFKYINYLENGICFKGLDL